MRSLSLLLLALPLTCTGVLVTGCSGAETQDVLAATASGDETDPGTDPSTDGTKTKADAGKNPTPDDCTPEEEPNDNQNEANKLAPERCGTLSSDDQKDFLTFRLKSSTKSMSVTLTGRVRLRISVRGKPTTELTPDTTTEIPFVDDADYYVEVTALNAGGKDVPWRVAVIEQ